MIREERQRDANFRIAEASEERERERERSKMVVLFFGAEALFILSVVLLLVLFCPLFEERRFGLFVNNFLILANL